MKKPTMKELVDAMDEKLPDPLRCQYFDVTGKPAIVYGEKGKLRTVAERIVRALKAPIEAFLRWWRKVCKGVIE